MGEHSTFQPPSKVRELLLTAAVPSFPALKSDLSQQICIGSYLLAFSLLSPPKDHATLFPTSPLCFLVIVLPGVRVKLTLLPIRKFRITAELETARWLDSDIADSAENASSARPFIYVRSVLLSKTWQGHKSNWTTSLSSARHAPLEWRKQILDNPTIPSGAACSHDGGRASFAVSAPLFQFSHVFPFVMVPNGTQLSKSLASFTALGTGCTSYRYASVIILISARVSMQSRKCP